MAVDPLFRYCLPALGSFLLAACGSEPRYSTTSAGASIGTSAIATTTTAAVTTTTGSAPSAPASMAIASSNQAPTIAGTAKSLAVVGESFSFVPAAADADGGTLSFSVEHLPRWLSFDSKTGALSGKPTSADIGVYSDVQVKVSDGIDTTSLPDFSITVLGKESLTGAVAISWQPPTENTDGSLLSTLAGHKIVYGTDPGALTSAVQLTNPSITSYIIENLAPGNWYFAVIAVATDGVESAMSAVVSKTIG